MRIIVCENYDEMSEKGARLFAGQIMLKPESVLGFATGGTPVGMYKKLAELYEKGETDFSKVTSFNLDEYYPISHENSRSYSYYMKHMLFDRVNIRPENTYIPDGMCKDPKAECERYEKLIKEKGGIDIQLLGIGRNGHIGFNEPDSALSSVTHVAELSESTICANSRFFDNIEDVPKKAITMGVATILQSRKIVMLVSGKEKRGVMKNMMSDEVTTENPATMLKVHPDAIIICDRAAYGA